MASKKKLLQAAAGSAGGAGLDINEVFHTEVYTGNGNVNIRTTGIDIATEGGLLWFKTRTGSTATNHCLIDTERPDTGSGYPYLQTNSTAGNELSETPFYAGSGIEPTTTGYQLGQTDQANKSGQTYVNWTFRKAPKFFDVVTWTGTGSAMTINHNLGQVPGMIIVKSTSASYNWAVWHREFTGSTDYIKLNSTAAKTDGAGLFGNGSTYLTPTSTQFFVGGNNQVSGEVGGGYVAYLFAHHNNDGEFGPDSDQDIIKCGSFTTDGTGIFPSVDLGFEPQFVLLKSATSSTSWFLLDNMREYSKTGTKPLEANAAAAETTSWGSNTYLGAPTATGFDGNGVGSGITNATIIYIAIRRGSLFPPTDATKVFSMDTQGSSAPYFDSNHIVDMALVKALTTTGDWYNYARIIGEKYLATNTTAAEANASEAGFDFMDGHIDAQFGSGFPRSSMWKRAPSYFDVVAYTGTGSARTVSHNLGAVPEMMWVKNRSAVTPWQVYHSALGNQAYLYLNATDAVSGTNNNRWNATTPTASVFTVGTSANVNGTCNNIIAYLFATVAGVSKISSVVHSGTTNVDCGFSNGARFVIIKRTDSTGNWFQFDTLRGYSSGNDSTIFLNTTDSEQLADYIDPLSSGFTLTSNLASGTYIYYAIA